ncbi:hypothetical protein PMAYCL1PPCAC_13765, partial [Pristionchus mayeri]
SPDSVHSPSSTPSTKHLLLAPPINNLRSSSIIISVPSIGSPRVTVVAPCGTSATVVQHETSVIPYTSKTRVGQSGWRTVLIRWSGKDSPPSSSILSCDRGCSSCCR